MFAARLHDTTLDTFTRQEALELPKSNPVLRSLFRYVGCDSYEARSRYRPYPVLTKLRPTGG